MDHITATRLARCDAFFAAADAEHGGRYDYSLLPDEFVNVKTRVRIICPEHGIFRMAPQDHKAKTVKGRAIPGQGCHSCSTDRPRAACNSSSIARARCTGPGMTTGTSTSSTSGPASAFAASSTEPSASCRRTT